MAQSKPARKKDKPILHRHPPTKPTRTRPIQAETADLLLAQARTLLQRSEPNEAHRIASRALALLEPDQASSIPALHLLGEANVELGDLDAARDFFLRAVRIDPDGRLPAELGVGAETFLWMAQLCEDGGTASVRWYEKGAKALQDDIARLEEERSTASAERGVPGADAKRCQLAQALCGAAEVYMTDLSWEADAESRCESLVTEALLVAPNSADALQTLASVRISQSRMEDARAALRRSVGVWKDLHPEDDRVPAYATRISLARLLLETEEEAEALTVLERLVAEDDQSVEAWYLGGWTLHIMADKSGSLSSHAEDGPDVDRKASGEQRARWRSSREWLDNALRLYRTLEYEDERLRDHAMELLDVLQRKIAADGSPHEDDDDEDEDEDEDEGEGEAEDQGEHEGEWEDESADNDPDKQMVDA
ncbi:MAG: hypothetical protein M1826_001097 [Phylliscum demangeonii]|nr:MAG: hypothetical protein M1826_001097 [Phylliscum demangeonii]